MAASHFSLFAGVLGAQTLARPLKRRTSSVARAGCRACVRRVGGRDMFRDILVQWQPHISLLAPVPLHWTPLRGLASLGCFTDCGARRGWVRALELRARRDNGRYVLRAAGPSVLGPLARERRMTRGFCRDSAWPAAQAPSQRGLTAALWTGPVRTSSLAAWHARACLVEAEAQPDGDLRRREGSRRVGSNTLRRSRKEPWAAPAPAPPADTPRGRRHPGRSRAGRRHAVAQGSGPRPCLGILNVLETAFACLLFVRSGPRCTPIYMRAPDAGRCDTRRPAPLPVPAFQIELELNASPSCSVSARIYTSTTRPLSLRAANARHGASRTRRKSCYCTPRARTQCRIRIARAITPSLLSVLDETAVHAASNDDTRAASQPMERRNVSQPKSTARPFPAVATLSSVGPVQGLAEPSNVVPSPGAIFSRGLWLPATAHLRSATSAPIAALR
ncbi:hypothetical protein ACCO45_004817 [Purpureocillium lilacinum]|uniref:Uncharacterized protein n=1 Tax=Purpureocillium lilacinum TaxID=33203 RepID=A0ACC4DTM9_PURLI